LKVISPYWGQIIKIPSSANVIPIVVIISFANSSSFIVTPI